jgi:hypothetical protein
MFNAQPATLWYCSRNLLADINPNTPVNTSEIWSLCIHFCTAQRSRENEALIVHNVTSCFWKNELSWLTWASSDRHERNFLLGKQRIVRVFTQLQVDALCEPNLFKKPVTVAERSKTWIVFARSEAWIVGSNPIQGMDVWYVYVFILCVVLCLGRGLATGWPLVQGVLPSVKWSKWKNNLDTVRYMRKGISK